MHIAHPAAAFNFLRSLYFRRGHKGEVLTCCGYLCGSHGPARRRDPVCPCQIPAWAAAFCQTGPRPPRPLCCVPLSPPSNRHSAPPAAASTPGSAGEGADERHQERPPRSPTAPRTPAVPAPPARRRGRDPAGAQRRGDSDHLTITTIRVVADSHACPARRDVSSHHRCFQSGNAWEDAPEFSGGARRRPSPHPTAAGGCSASLSLSGALS